MDAVLGWMRNSAARAVTTVLRNLDRCLLIVVGLLVLYGVIDAIGVEKPTVAHDLAVNIAAGGTAIAVAYGMFWLRFRWYARRRVIAKVGSQLAASRTSSEPVFARTRLAAALSTNLRRRILRSVVVMGEAGSGRRVFLRAVARDLAAHGRLPVIIDGADLGESESLVEAAKARFSRWLAEEDQNTQDSDRLWELLLRRRRLFVLVHDLDAFLVAATGRRRRSRIKELIDELHERCIPFVVVLPGWLLTMEPDIGIIRLPLLLPDQLAVYVGQLLGTGTGDDRLDTGDQDRLRQCLGRTQSRYLLELSVRHAVAGGGGDLRQSVDLLVESHQMDRQIQREHVWLCDAAGLEGDGAADVAAGDRLDCLARLGRRMLAASTDSYPWDRLLVNLDDAQQERMLLARSALEIRGIVDVRSQAGVEVVSFVNPVWLGFAGGLGIDLAEDATWPTLLGDGPSEPSLKALSVATARALAEPGCPPVTLLGLLRRAGLRDIAAQRLNVLTAIIDGLLCSDRAQRSEHQVPALLTSAWSDADDEARLRFVATCDLERQGEVARFLWNELAAPEDLGTNRNSYRVRRAITWKIAEAGHATWDRFGPDWTGRARAGFAGDLSSASRTKAHARQYRSTLAHLGWILPVLVECAPERREQVYGLTQELAQSFMKPYSRYGLDARTSPPDIGLEISLFEGIKMAAARCWLNQTRPSEQLKELVLDTTTSARSWLSRMAAIHAATLLEGTEQSGTFLPFVRRFTAAGQHPFVRQAARVSLDAIQAGPGMRERLFRSVWLDDAETLRSGGAELLDAPHGLLAMSTLLINLIEERGWIWKSQDPNRTPLDVDSDGQAIREDVFTSSRLPQCLQRGGRDWQAASTCACDLYLCEKPLTARGTRGVGSAFLQRARTTTGRAQDTVVKNPFARVGFRLRARSTFDRLQTIAADRERSEAEAQAREEHIW